MIPGCLEKNLDWPVLAGITAFLTLDADYNDETT
jgi:hypothetical protein